MTRVCVSAPGKAVIAGEYAVLFGAPAVVAAIDRRVQVRIEDSDDEYCRITTPGLAEGAWRFRAGPGGTIDWQDETAGEHLGLFEVVWQACAGDVIDPVSIEVDTRAFFDETTGSKLGLGSSAAVAVALAGALTPTSGNPQEVWSLARQIHREFQGGRGSGVDVAASTFGGLLAYRASGDSPPRSLEWPQEIHSRFLWSGSASDTREKLSRLGEPDDAAIAALADAAECTLAAWQAGKASAILFALRGYADVLARFSEAFDLGIFDAGHDDLFNLARRLDVVYKPCGAGGGDIGVAMAENADTIETFCERAEQLGFTTPGFECDAKGMTVLEEDRS